MARKPGKILEKWTFDINGVRVVEVEHNKSVDPQRVKACLRNVAFNSTAREALNEGLSGVLGEQFDELNVTDVCAEEDF